MKKIIAYINAEGELRDSIIRNAQAYENNGIDELLIYNHTENEAERDEFLDIMKEVVRRVDIPVMAGCYVKRFEDGKKAFYTGAKKIVVQYKDIRKTDAFNEITRRFGSENVCIEVDLGQETNDGFFNDFATAEEIKKLNAGTLILKHVTISDKLTKRLQECPVPVLIRDSLIRNDIESLITLEGVEGVITNYYDRKLTGVTGYPYDEKSCDIDNDIMKIKLRLKENGIEVNTFSSTVTFADLKKNSDGMVPVIVQDYKSSEVLMLAYMDEEAYDKTVETGIMTYYSRSRKELWVKGKTSGHYQYVKSIETDCDRDTLLAKVHQIGAACHTGNVSCFYTNLLKHEFEERNPYKIFTELYSVVADRKLHPKEGSYTNYLFDKGMDKILKKCGEEATEIVIAAKNPNAEELKYEISDFLYHMVVLMVECGIDWDDIAAELSHRH